MISIFHELLFKRLDIMKCFSSIKTVAALFFSLIACDSNAMKQALHPYNVDTEQLKADFIKLYSENIIPASRKQMRDAAEAGEAEDQYYYAKYLANRRYIIS